LRHRSARDLTGKTTHIAKVASEAAARFGSERVVISSLTRAAAHEIASRRVPIPRDAVGTMHALAWRALGRPRLVDDVAAGEWNASVGDHWRITGRRAEAGAIKSGDDHRPDEKSDGLSGDKLLERSSHYRSRLWPREKWPDVEVSRFDERWEAWKREREVVDFQDMIGLALQDCETAPGRPSILYLDEAQDSSTAEIALAMKWGRAAGHVVSVGDPDQSIYGWRGADPGAFLAMATRDHRRVLEQSFRIPRAVHAHAVEWIERLGARGRERVLYHPRDAEGEFVRRPDLLLDYPEAVMDEILRDAEAGMRVMVLATCSYMLEPLRRLLKTEAVPFHNPHRPSRGDWNPLRGTSKRVTDYLAPCAEVWGEQARPWTWKRLWSWIELVDARYLSGGAKAEIKRMATTEATADMPLCESLDLCRESLDAVFADGMNQWDGDPSRLRKLLLGTAASKMEYPISVAERRGGRALREEPKIVLGTVHSTKGAETDSVFLFPDLSMSAWREWPTAEGETAIRRLFYVGMTRAREKLVIGGSAGRRVPEL
jgi:superfamily I DNA/RNA helicase